MYSLYQTRLLAFQCCTRLTSDQPGQGYMLSRDRLLWHTLRLVFPYSYTRIKFTMAQTMQRVKSSPSTQTRAQTIPSFRSAVCSPRPFTSQQPRASAQFTSVQSAQGQRQVSIVSRAAPQAAPTSSSSASDKVSWIRHLAGCHLPASLLFTHASHALACISALTMMSALGIVLNA